jgi:NADPH oxidase
MDVFNPARRETVEINKPTTPDGKTYLLRLDGPFGTCADDVWNYETVMMACAGIGVTPYASLLKHIGYRLHADKNLKIKKVFFYWINRDEGSWEWFSELLSKLETKDPNFFEIKTFMTGNVSEKEIRQIIFSSEEYQNRAPSNSTPQNVELLARATYRYDAQSGDELSFEENDMITIIEKDDSGWWKGLNQTTKQTGVFPYNYVTLVDKVTKLANNKNRNFGRPQWENEFKQVHDYVAAYTPDMATRKIKPKVGVFFCGPHVLSKELYRQAQKITKTGSVQFDFHKENF